MIAVRPEKDKASVLGEAVLNAGVKLGLSHEEVGRIVGRNRTTISRNGIDPDSTNGQVALILIRVYRGLYALVGGNEDHMVHWMNTEITPLDNKPVDMIFDVSSLVQLVEFIDAMRGKG